MINFTFSPKCFQCTSFFLLKTRVLSFTLEFRVFFTPKLCIFSSSTCPQNNANKPGFYIHGALSCPAPTPTINAKLFPTPTNPHDVCVWDMFTAQNDGTYYIPLVWRHRECSGKGVGVTGTERGSVTKIMGGASGGGGAALLRAGKKCNQMISSTYILTQAPPPPPRLFVYFICSICHTQTNTHTL